MAGSRSYDLTNGPIFKKLSLVAVPIMGTSLMQMAYNLTDMFWLGRLKDNGLSVASSGSAGMFLWLSFGLVLFGRTGSEIGVSQNLGKGDPETAKKYSHAAVSISALLGILCMIASVFFGKQLIGVFNIKEANVVADAAKYLAIVGLSSPQMFISYAIMGTFNGSGNSGVSFIASGVGLAVNMILDPILILGLHMGITGAAIATALAQTIVFVIFVFALKKSGRPFETYRFFVRPDFRKIQEIIRQCLPVSLESMFFTAMAMVTTRFVADYGASAITVQRVGSQVESLSWLIGGSFGSAVTAFVGQNYGAGLWTRIRKGYNISVATMLVWGVITTTLLYFGGGFIFSLFLTDKEFFEAGAVYLRILSVCQLFTCLESVSAGAFRGAGKTLPSSAVSIVTNFIRVILCYLLSLTPLGLNGIWWGITITGILRGLGIYVWFRVFIRKLPHEDAAALTAAV